MSKLLYVCPLIQTYKNVPCFIEYKSLNSLIARRGLGQDCWYCM
jgi:hypothetical protein